MNVKPPTLLFTALMLDTLAMAEVIALADTTNFPPVLPSKPVPLKYQYPYWTYPYPTSPGVVANPQAGIYETRPYEIRLKVPAQTGDNSVIRNSAPSPMPVLHPELKVIPVLRAGK
jgi:hypothetical protein